MVDPQRGQTISFLPKTNSKTPIQGRVVEANCSAYGGEKYLRVSIPGRVHIAAVYYSEFEAKQVKVIALQTGVKAL